jgi:epoxyqueuosine reductase
MNVSTSSPAANAIIGEVCRLGASLAGVLTLDSLLDTPSQGGQHHPYWPKWASSVLVYGLHHPPDQPQLDRWGGKLGTPGNRQLIGIGARMIETLAQVYVIQAHDLPYAPSSGGIYLKEAAVKAGLGVIGKNNLLVTPEFGPHLRLRAMLLDMSVDDAPLMSTFDPCRDCPAPCWYRCPQEAFSDGSYRADRCRHQLQRDEMWPLPHDKSTTSFDERYVIAYCRECDLSCPVGSR